MAAMRASVALDTLSGSASAFTHNWLSARPYRFWAD
jgi:hypothetical protein